MFTFTAVKNVYYDEILYDFNLSYTDDAISMNLTPENPSKIVIAEEGEFCSLFNNGSFNFRWTQAYFYFEVGKNGDGNGGTIYLKIKNTSELFDSFVTALEEWNTYVS